MYVQLVLIPKNKWEKHISIKTSQLLWPRMTYNTKMCCEYKIVWLCQIPEWMSAPCTSWAQSRYMDRDFLPWSLFLCQISWWSCCRAEAWKSQDLSDLTASQQGTSEACSLGVWCSCISGTVWGDEGVRSNHFRKAKQSFHFSGKLKIVFLHSGWNAGVGILVQKYNKTMEWKF